MLQKLKLGKLLLFLFFSCQIQAQGNSRQSLSGLNNWFVELGGSAIQYSLNYEKYLYKSYNENLFWTARVGAGYNFSNKWVLNKIYLEGKSILVPFTTSVSFGERKEKIEVGGGFTMMTTNFRESRIIPTGILGFRVRESNGVCFRVNYIPMIMNNELVHWMGVSLGMNFGATGRR